jgi:hypothetical protein
MLNKIKQALELGELANVPVTLQPDELRFLITVTEKLMQQNEVAREKMINALGLLLDDVADHARTQSEARTIRILQDALAKMDEIGGME